MWCVSKEQFFYKMQQEIKKEFVFFIYFLFLKKINKKMLMLQNLLSILCTVLFEPRTTCALEKKRIIKKWPKIFERNDFNTFSQIL